MRGLRSTLLLLVALVGLGAYIYFVESERDPAAADAKPRAFSELAADTIEEIRIKNADGEVSRVQRAGDGWELVEPTKALADTGVVGTVTTNLASLEVQRVVDENPSDLKQYGLDPARVEVAFKTGGQERRLLIGRKTPPGTDLYAKVGDSPRVFLVSSYLDSTFNRGTFDLRDKSVLAVDRDSIEAVSITTGNSTVQYFRFL